MRLYIFVSAPTFLCLKLLEYRFPLAQVSSVCRTMHHCSMAPQKLSSTEHLRLLMWSGVKYDLDRAMWRSYALSRSTLLITLLVTCSFKFHWYIWNLASSKYDIWPPTIDKVKDYSSTPTRSSASIGGLPNGFEGFWLSFLSKRYRTYLVEIWSLRAIEKWPAPILLKAIIFILWSHVDCLRPRGAKGGMLAISLEMGK